MKINISILIILLVYSLTSCRKDRTCECQHTITTITSGIGPSGPYSQTTINSNTETRSYKNVSEKAVSTMCYSTKKSSSNASANNTTTSITDEDICTLK